MKKGPMIAVLVIVVILIGGGFALFHKSSKPTTNSESANTSSVSDAVIVTKTSSSLGKYLAEPDGQALYTYSQDSSGVSNCAGSCLATWPAYQDTGSTANLPSGISTIRRSDNNEIQYTYNGMPLYTFVSDRNGDITGNGVADFSIAKPVSSAANSTSSNNSSSNW
jgi:predicted lipoprotein with Yx(FWY)xxD motif